jgi:heptosyltransferase-2
MSTPFLFELRSRHPGARIIVLCRPEHAAIFQNHPSVDETLILSVHTVLDDSFDTGYILPTSFSSAWQFYRARLPVRIGHAAGGRSFLLTQAVPLDPRFHYVRRYLSLLGRESLPSSALRFSFPLTDAGRHEWEELKVSSESKLQGPLLAIAPGSRASARRYPPERFAALADLFVKHFGGSVVLVGSGEDEMIAREVCTHVSSPIANLCGKTSLEGMGSVLKECRALLTNESGTMHVAWALGVPSVALAGPSDTALTAPWEGAATLLQRRELWCVPCVRNECPRPGRGYKECLTLISVEEAWEVLRATIESSSFPHSSAGIQPSGSPLPRG